MDPVATPRWRSPIALAGGLAVLLVALAIGFAMAGGGDGGDDGALETSSSSSTTTRAATTTTAGGTGVPATGPTTVPGNGGDGGGKGAGLPPAFEAPIELRHGQDAVAIAADGSVVALEVSSGDRTATLLAADDEQPAVSVAAGRGVVYVERARPQVQCQASSEVIALPLDGGAPERVAQGATAPASDPGHSRLAYVVGACPGAPDRLVVLAADGTRRTYGLGPASEPDGFTGGALGWLDDRTVVYVWWPDTSEPPELWAVDVGSGKRRAITALPTEADGDTLSWVSFGGHGGDVFGLAIRVDVQNSTVMTGLRRVTSSGAGPALAERAGVGGSLDGSGPQLLWVADETLLAGTGSPHVVATGISAAAWV